MILQPLQYNAPTTAPVLCAHFGTSPSGSMQTRIDSNGFLEMVFTIPAAQQRSYHPNPNVWHNGMQHTTLLLDDEEGRNWLLRFQYAFLNGLCFKVGRDSNEVECLLSTSYPPSLLDDFRIPTDPQQCYDWILENQSSLSIAAQFDFGASEYPSVAPLSSTTMRQGSEARKNPSFQSEVLYFDKDQSSSVDHRNSRLLDPVPMCRVAGEEEECPICLETMVPTSTSTCTDKVVCIKNCRHRFHRKCITKMFRYGHDKCPNCREPVDIEPFGDGPSGSMTIKLDPLKRCKGFESTSDGVITIHYNMQGGIQHDGMEEPGRRYSGKSRSAYLPHNETGRKLLARLKYAFTHGLLFRVKRLGITAQIKWTSIYFHKTSLRDYPDPKYFIICNKWLDKLKVPKANDCTPSRIVAWT